MSKLFNETFVALDHLRRSAIRARRRLSDGSLADRRSPIAPSAFLRHREFWGILMATAFRAIDEQRANVVGEIPDCDEVDGTINRIGFDTITRGYRDVTANCKSFVEAAASPGTVDKISRPVGSSRCDAADISRIFFSPRLGYNYANALQRDRGMSRAEYQLSCQVHISLGFSAAGSQKFRVRLRQFALTSPLLLPTTRRERKKNKRNARVALAKVESCH